MQNRKVEHERRHKRSLFPFETNRIFSEISSQKSQFTFHDTLVSVYWKMLGQ